MCRIKRVFLFIIVMFSHAVLADEFEIAQAYLASYSDFNLNELASYYSDNAVFEDLTSENFGENAFIIKGKENILKRFNTSFFQTKFRLRYKIIHQFESSGYHVFISEVTARQKKKQQANFSCGNVVSIIKIVDKKVISHVDYADYKGFVKTSKNPHNQCLRFTHQHQ